MTRHVAPNFKAPLRRKVSKVSRDRAELRATKLALMARSGGRCEANFSPLCTGVGTEIHHLKRRSAGGDNSLANTAWSCTACHQRVHASPAEAVAAGLLLPSWA